MFGAEASQSFYRVGFFYFYAGGEGGDESIGEFKFSKGMAEAGHPQQDWPFSFSNH